MLVIDQGSTKRTVVTPAKPSSRPPTSAPPSPILPSGHPRGGGSPSSSAAHHSASTQTQTHVSNPTVRLHPIQPIPAVLAGGLQPWAAVTGRTVQLAGAPAAWISGRVPRGLAGTIPSAGSKVVLLGRATSPAFARPGSLVVTSMPMTVWRYYGGRAPEKENLFLITPPHLFTSGAARIHLGTAVSAGNALDYRAKAVIPAGSVLKVGVAKPNTLVPGPPQNYLGGGQVVQFADSRDLRAVKWEQSFWLPDDGGDPWGEGHHDLIG